MFSGVHRLILYRLCHQATANIDLILEIYIASIHHLPASVACSLLHNSMCIIIGLVSLAPPMIQYTIYNHKLSFCQHILHGFFVTLIVTSKEGAPGFGRLIQSVRRRRRQIICFCWRLK